jgi:hypothetical protein
MISTKANWVDAFHLELYGVRVPRWYAFDKTDKPLMRPFPTREECEHEIAMTDRGAP